MGHIQASHSYLEHHPPAVDRHIGHGPQMIAVHSPRRHPAHRAARGLSRSPRPHHDPPALIDHILDDQRGYPRKHHLYKLVDIHHTENNDIRLSVTTEYETEPKSLQTRPYRVSILAWSARSMTPGGASRGWIGSPSRRC